MSELLNQLLCDFVYEDDWEGVDITFIRSLQNIITKQNVSLQQQSYRTKVGIEKTKEYAHQFLKKLDSRYDDYFTILLDAGVIHIHDRMKRVKKLSTMSIMPIGKVIDIYATKTIEDAYTYVHELMHSWNCDENHLTVSWHLMTECFSILAESLECDDMINLHPEAKKNKRDTYYALQMRAIMLQFELDLVDLYMAHGYIDDELMLHYLKSKTSYERWIINFHLDWIEEKESLRFDSLQRDIIGGVMASYMHNRILERPTKIKEFIELNDHCNEMSFLDILRYLDLEIEDEYSWQLSKKSLQTLENSYQKELKSL